MTAQDRKERVRLDSLSLELASESELEAVAEHAAQPERRREARALALERSRELARRAAQDLQAFYARPRRQYSPVCPKLI